MTQKRIHTWLDGDVIIEERANGVYVYPNWVESGLDLSINAANVDVTAGTAHVGAFRVSTTGIPTTVTIIDNQTNYIYLEVTRTLVAGELTGVSAPALVAYSSLQTFSGDDYGVLIGTCIKSGGVITVNSVEETNRDLPVAIGTNVVRVAPSGGDYENFQRAIKESVAGSLVICHRGANYILTEQLTIAKDLHVINIATQDYRDPSTTILEIQVTAPAVSGSLITMSGGDELYIEGLEFIYDGGRIFEISGGSILTLDKSKTVSTDTGLEQIKITDSKLDMLQARMQTIQATPAVTTGASCIYITGTGAHNVVIWETSMGGNADNGFAIKYDSTGAGGLTLTQCQIDSGGHNTTKTVIIDSANSVFITSCTLRDVLASGGIALSQSLGTVFVTDSTLFSANLSISQSAGAIFWDQTSACSGNNNSNVIGGTITNLRVPQDTWETPRVEDITQNYNMSAAGGLAVNDDQDRVIVPKGCNLVIIYGFVGTAPTGADITIEIEKSSDGAVWSTLVASANFSITAGTLLGNFTPSVGTANVSSGDILRLNIDQVGSGVAGSDLNVGLAFKRNSG